MKRNVLTSQRIQVFQTINKGYGKFNDIKNICNIKSNELSYHLKVLLDNDLITKERSGEVISYSLSKRGKQIYPYVSTLLQDEIPVVVVCALIALKGDKVLLIRKENEPEKDSLILPGAKADKEFDLDENMLKIAKDRFKIEVKNLNLKHINEFVVKDEGKMLHHWVVHFYMADLVSYPDSAVIVKKSEIGRYDFFGDNSFILDSVFKSKGLKVTKTVIDSGSNKILSIESYS
jgi:ADP-ribose pyrophosphatase YjhB (NUDIX family)